MLTYLLLTLLLTAVCLTVLLWAGTFFFQGYIYTEPSPGIFWQAPVAGILLTIGYTIWTLSIAIPKGSSPQNLPYDALHRFSPKEEMTEWEGKPAPKLWAIKVDRKKTGDDKDGERIEYNLVRDSQVKFHYEDAKGTHRPWQPSGVIAIELDKKDGSKMRFELTPTEQRDYRQFVSKDGWVIREYEEGPTGLPVKFRWGRWFINLFFNFGHLVMWFVGLWLVLRFQWTHAIGFALILWLIATLIFLPMLLGYAGLVSANRSAPPTALMRFGLPIG